MIGFVTVVNALETKSTNGFRKDMAGVCLVQLRRSTPVVPLQDENSTENNANSQAAISLSEIDDLNKSDPDNGLGDSSMVIVPVDSNANTASDTSNEYGEAMSTSSNLNSSEAVETSTEIVVVNNASAATNSATNTANPSAPVRNNNRKRSVHESEIKSRMVDAAKEGSKLRFRIRMWTIGPGAALLTISNTIRGRIESGELDHSTFGHQDFYMIPLTPAAFLMLLGMTATDTISIRVVSLFFCVGAFFNGIEAFFIAANYWFTERHVFRNFEGQSTVHYCGSDLPDIGCALHVVVYPLIGVIASVGFYGIFGNLARVGEIPVYDSTQQKGFRFRDRAFKYPARVALDRLWFYIRLTYFSFGVVIFIATVAQYCRW